MKKQYITLCTLAVTLGMFTSYTALGTPPKAQSVAPASQDKDGFEDVSPLNKDENSAGNKFAKKLNKKSSSHKTSHTQGSSDENLPMIMSKHDAVHNNSHMGQNLLIPMEEDAAPVRHKAQTGLLMLEENKSDDGRNLPILLDEKDKAEGSQKKDCSCPCPCSRK